MLFIFIGILSICLIATIIYGVLKYKKDNDYYYYEGDNNVVLGVLIAIALVVIIFVGLFGLSFNYVDYTTAENNIIIVEESNAELETEVAESIKQYITYEGEEFKALKPDTNNTELIAFAESYPNLQSSKLIQEQINTYKENKKKIVKLKQSQVKARQTIKFWTFINLK